MDDAISWGFWDCAKLLASYGAKQTIPMTEHIQARLDATDISTIRAEVHKEKVRSLS